jgi:hypothetical protein
VAHVLFLHEDGSVRIPRTQLALPVPIAIRLTGTADAALVSVLEEAEDDRNYERGFASASPSCSRSLDGPSGFRSCSARSDETGSFDRHEWYSWHWILQGDRSQDAAALARATTSSSPTITRRAGRLDCATRSVNPHPPPPYAVAREDPFEPRSAPASAPVARYRRPGGVTLM